MIPLEKLTKLPRSQMLRKMAKIVGEAEHRLLSSGSLPLAETEYLGRMMELVSGTRVSGTRAAQDNGFSAPAKEALKNAQTCLLSATSSEKEIRRALNGVYHLLLAETGRYPADWDFTESSGALDPSKRRFFPGMQVYLEDIRSPFNVGSMFRAAESFGVEKLWLSPLCADPRHKRAERTAMGCVDVLPWERLTEDPFAGPMAAADFSGPFFALETGGIPLSDFPFPPTGILIAGSEELGVSPQALAAADASLGRVTIPTFGAKGSLNVSVAFGIVMQAWCSYHSQLARRFPSASASIAVVSALASRKDFPSKV